MPSHQGALSEPRASEARSFVDGESGSKCRRTPAFAGAALVLSTTWPCGAGSPIIPAGASDLAWGEEFTGRVVTGVCRSPGYRSPAWRPRPGPQTPQYYNNPASKAPARNTVPAELVATTSGSSFRASFDRIPMGQRLQRVNLLPFCCCMLVEHCLR